MTFESEELFIVATYIWLKPMSFFVLTTMIYLTTLTLKFALLFKNFNLGCYLVMVATWRTSLSSDYNFIYSCFFAEFRIKLNPVIMHHEGAVYGTEASSGTDYAKKLYDLLKDDILVARQVLKEMYGLGFMQIIDIFFDHEADHVTLHCSISCEDDLEIFVDEYRKGKLTEKFTEYLRGMGFGLSLGIDPTDENTTFQCYVCFEQMLYIHGKSHFKENSRNTER